VLHGDRDRRDLLAKPTQEYELKLVGSGGASYFFSSRGTGSTRGMLV
jgi:hypothetical protein